MRLTQSTCYPENAKDLEGYSLSKLNLWFCHVDKEIKLLNNYNIINVTKSPTKITRRIKNK